MRSQQIAAALQFFLLAGLQLERFQFLLLKFKQFDPTRALMLVHIQRAYAAAQVAPHGVLACDGGFKLVQLVPRKRIQIAELLPFIGKRLMLVLAVHFDKARGYLL